jgi:hypothetical protein
MGIHSLLTGALIALGVLMAIAVAMLRALAIEELHGHIRRRIEASVERTIASLPADLQEEWANEWRGELAATISMPLTAILFARGLRRTAYQLVGKPNLALAAGARWRARLHRVVTFGGLVLLSEYGSTIFLCSGALLVGYLFLGGLVFFLTPVLVMYFIMLFIASLG